MAYRVPDNLFGKTLRQASKMTQDINVRLIDEQAMTKVMHDPNKKKFGMRRLSQHANNLIMQGPKRHRKRE